MKKLLYLYFALATLLTFGCGKHQSNDKVQLQEVEFAPPPPEAASTGEMNVAKEEADAVSPEKTQQPVSKKIIKEGEISLETGNLQSTRKAIIQNLTKLGGYMDEESETNDNGNIEQPGRNFILKVRIPAEQFDRFLATATEAADRVESKNIRIKDVTTEFIDITTRLANMQLLENRYKQLLQQSSRMADILQIEDKLTEVRTNIETAQGQLNYLNKQIAYSSLTITLFTKSAARNDGNTFGYQLKTALSSGWQNLQGLFFGIISIWPYLLLIVLIIWAFKAWRRRKQ
ncbi:DUF4349 domain-containing protein [Mucilaginibacter sp. Bleaf8]|uniref:DUF4349 domain-containing protein n=1 Tax=Mucilaginibacter sp. Bleaf8 TaxID=2834430 RepID=UPI001BCED2DE|nr:DUF4349 domain-containing protein [Mucilaginibacter sp. Bleaf8]MBS7566564.1 DUF4349 domain-containing protein [Mucilaginibacter sp. Bleaf8]